MRNSTVQKICGASLVFGALLLAVYSISFSLLLPVKIIRQDMAMAVLNPGWIPIAMAAFLGLICIMFGLVAVYSRISGESGITGLFGFLIIEIAYLLQASKVTWEMCLYPLFVSQDRFIPLLRESIIKNYVLVGYYRIAVMSTIFIGIVLFCIALIRSKQFPKIAGILIATGGIIYGVGSFLPVFVPITAISIHSIGFIILGITLLMHPKGSPEQAGE
jgi:hypothetical protein